ncbi:MAG: hypothetical protein LQ352_004967, partial [Teloschistes flavicans]
MFPRRSIVVFASLLLLSAIILIIHQIDRQSPGFIQHLVPSRPGNKGHGEKEIEENTGPCGRGIAWLAKLDLKYPISYAQREIIVRPTPGAKRQSLTNINQPLFPQAKQILVNQESRLELPDCQQEPLILEVPDTPLTPINASRMHFGIATTLDRLADSTPMIERWLAHTSAKLFVVIIKPDEGESPTAKQLSARQSELRKRAMDVTLLPPLKEGQLYTETYFSLVKIMYTHRTAAAQWFVLMDDDTFFPSLLAMLDHYNPDHQYYIGAVSEMWWSVARYGMMAFGGAGIFLSHALASVIDAVYETCTGEMHPAAGGDERVMRCVYRHSDAKLTNEAALHQMDIYGDLSGVYENGRLPLSLHHWKGGEYPVERMSRVSDVCGDCFLQRWRFADDTVVANGYSIAVYPEGVVGGVDFERAEETWEVRTVEGSVNPGSWHSLGMARERLVLDDEKIQYRLVESGPVGGGVVRQVYIHKSETEGDTVLVL